MTSKQSKDDDPNEAFDGFLREWKEDRVLPSQFSRDVRRRIFEIESAQIPLKTIVRSLVSKILLGLSQPKWACACILVFLIAGICSGLISARRETERVNHVLSERYVSMIAPENPQP